MFKDFVVSQTKNKQNGFGACLKQPVHAMLKVLKNGEQFYGSNEMYSSPGKSCPREDLNLPTGEGYNLCKERCNQKFHAEYEAVERALSSDADLRGSTMYLTGHHYCCEKCSTHMRKHGVKNVFYIDSNKLEAL